MPDLVIIDARKKSDYEKGYIEGAHNLANTSTTEASLAQLVPGKDHPVLFYCNGINAKIGEFECVQNVPKKCPTFT